MAKALITDDNQTIEFLKNARDMAFIFTVFLYYMGWVYIYYYLGKFGLSVKAVDVSLYNLLIYSSNVFIYLYKKQMLLILIVLLAFILVRYYKGAQGLFTRLFPFFIAALFPIVFIMAKAAGTDAAALILQNPGQLQSIKFIFKDIKMDSVPNIKTLGDSLTMDNNEERINILNQNKQGSFRLLVANDIEYYVLQYSAHYNSNSPMIYFIKKDKVEFASITR